MPAARNHWQQAGAGQRPVGARAGDCERRLNHWRRVAFPRRGRQLGVAIRLDSASRGPGSCSRSFSFALAADFWAKVIQVALFAPSIPCHEDASAPTLGIGALANKSSSVGCSPRRPTESRRRNRSCRVTTFSRPNWRPKTLDSAEMMDDSCDLAPTFAKKWATLRRTHQPGEQVASSALERQLESRAFRAPVTSDRRRRAAFGEVSYELSGGDLRAVCSRLQCLLWPFSRVAPRVTCAPDRARESAECEAQL